MRICISYRAHEDQDKGHSTNFNRLVLHIANDRSHEICMLASQVSTEIAWSPAGRRHGVKAEHLDRNAQHRADTLIQGASSCYPRQRVLAAM